MLCFVSSSRTPLCYVSSGELVNAGGFLHPARCLDTFVLLVGLEGTLHIAQGGVSHALSSGQYMLLLPHHHHHGCLRSEGPLSYFWCHFYCDGEYQLVEEHELGRHLQADAAAELGRDVYLLSEHRTLRSVNRIILECRQLMDFSRQPMHAKSIVDYCLSMLVLDLSQECFHGSAHGDAASGFCKLVDVQEYIRLNYPTNFTIAQLAEVFGYNPNYLSTAFKRSTGVSLVQYINGMRIDAAKTLLLNTSEAISSIADMVGFNDSKYFIRVFKQYEDVTPVKFRNTYFRKHINRQ